VNRTVGEECNVLVSWRSEDVYAQVQNVREGGTRRLCICIPCKYRERGTGRQLVTSKSYEILRRK
jgi:hypothetical protein